jgi:hypothetical protein
MTILLLILFPANVVKADAPDPEPPPRFAIAPDVVSAYARCAHATDNKWWVQEHAWMWREEDVKAAVAYYDWYADVYDTVMWIHRTEEFGEMRELYERKLRGLLGDHDYRANRLPLYLPLDVVPLNTDAIFYYER